MDGRRTYTYHHRCKVAYYYYIIKVIAILLRRERTRAEADEQHKGWVCIHPSRTDSDAFFRTENLRPAHNCTAFMDDPRLGTILTSGSEGDIVIMYVPT